MAVMPYNRDMLKAFFEANKLVVAMLKLDFFCEELPVKVETIGCSIDVSCFLFDN